MEKVREVREGKVLNGCDLRHLEYYYLNDFLVSNSGTKCICPTKIMLQINTILTIHLSYSDNKLLA